MPTLLPLWRAARTTGKQCGLTATGDYQPSLRSPWLAAVVVRCGRERAGLVVDELYGELQTVIKPLGSIFQRLEGISGATVLGSGEVAMILDVPSLTRIAKRQGPGRKEAGQGKLN
ncbi:MAG: chemotaxis protein CheW [Candidatus Sedimenticola sp. (ex Thyasira tokunagai)]